MDTTWRPRCAPASVAIAMNRQHVNNPPRLAHAIPDRGQAASPASAAMQDLSSFAPPGPGLGRPLTRPQTHGRALSALRGASWKETSQPGNSSSHNPRSPDAHQPKWAEETLCRRPVGDRGAGVSQSLRLRHACLIGFFCFLRRLQSPSFDENTRRACFHRSARKLGVSSSDGAALIAHYCCAVWLGFDAVNTAMQPTASLPPAEEQTVLCAAGMGT